MTDKYRQMIREWKEECQRMATRQNPEVPVFRGRFGKREPLHAVLKICSETGEITTFPVDRIGRS